MIKASEANCKDIDYTPQQVVDCHAKIDAILKKTWYPSNKWRNITDTFNMSNSDLLKKAVIKQLKRNGWRVVTDNEDGQRILVANPSLRWYQLR